MSNFEDLVDQEESAWPVVEDWVRDATNPVEVLPVDAARAKHVLTLLQVTTRSPLGAIAHHSGGLSIDGWLRVLGGGGPRMQGDLARYNGLGEEAWLAPIPGSLIIALDVLGGAFALAGASQQVAYFSPDSLQWSELGLGYSEWLHGMMRADLDEFFAGLRWPSWRLDVAELDLDQGVHVYPPLWSRESKTGEVRRKPVALRELVGLGFDAARKLDG